MNTDKSDSSKQNTIFVANFLEDDFDLSAPRRKFIPSANKSTTKKPQYGSQKAGSGRPHLQNWDTSRRGPMPEIRKPGPVALRNIKQIEALYIKDINAVKEPNYEPIPHLLSPKEVTEAKRKNVFIMVIRILLPVIALILAIGLYLMIDDFISQNQHNRFHRVFFGSHIERI
ncbi:MAG: hypothetical protein FWC91_02530 [Defluviitaleaceae bacterium]|nr:hypothetical protein [Defluviitaleaceae bacterium]